MGGRRMASLWNIQTVNEYKRKHLRFGVLGAVLTTTQGFWDVMLCRIIKIPTIRKIVTLIPSWLA
jgi:hypothetical protein